MTESDKAQWFSVLKIWIVMFSLIIGSTACVSIWTSNEYAISKLVYELRMKGK